MAKNLEEHWSNVSPLTLCTWLTCSQNHVLPSLNYKQYKSVHFMFWEDIWKSSASFDFTKKPDELFPRIIHFFGLCYQTLRSHTSMEFTAIKSLDLNINWICPREGSLHFIFLNFFFQDFLKAFFTIKIHIIFVLIQTVFTQ